MATTLDSYKPYDTGPGSGVTESDWRNFSKYWRGDGVIRSVANQFAVFGDSTGMQVKVPTGECWIQGHWGSSTSQKTLSIAAAHATLGRRDLVILRNDFVNNRIELDIKTGTAAASPVYPPLVQNASMWEIQLGKVVVDAAVVTIAAGKVTALQEFTDGSCRYTVDSGFQSFTTGTAARIDFDVSQFDSSAIDRPSIREFTIMRAGMWMVVLNAYWATNVTGSRAVWIRRQSSATNYLAFSKIAPSPDGGTAQNVVALERFTAGTIIEAYGQQNSGSTLTMLGSGSDFEGTSIAFYWLGP
jgi:hypothetical protein